MGVVIVEEPIDRALSRPANGSCAVFELAWVRASVSGVGHEEISEPGPRNSRRNMPRFLGAGKGCVRHEASRPSVVETPNTAGEIMTKDVVSVLVGSSVRDVAILLLEKRMSAVPVLAANLELLGMVSEGDLMGRSDTDRVARRDWWLTLLKDFQPQTETIAALAARPVEQIMRAPDGLGPLRRHPARLGACAGGVRFRPSAYQV